MNYTKIGILAIHLLLISLLSCTSSSGPEPINFGKDQCAYCRMTISDPQFGAELITDKGRVSKYDAAECLVNDINESSPSYAKLYAVAYNEPKTLKPVEELRFVISPDFRSPMGANLVAFSDTAQIDEKYQSQIIDWNKLLETL